MRWCGGWENPARLLQDLIAGHLSDDPALSLAELYPLELQGDVQAACEKLPQPTCPDLQPNMQARSRYVCCQHGALTSTPG